MSQEKFRSLDNYKSSQMGVAKSKGVEKELQAARTLTEARRVVYGEKKKNHEANKARGSNKWKR